MRDTGVVDQAVDPPEPIDRGGDQGGPVLVRCDVADQGEAVRETVDELGDRVGASRSRHDPGTGGMQAVDQPAADA